MPGSASGIRAGAAFVEMGLRDNALTKGLRAAEAKLKSFGSAIAGIGAKVAGLGAAIATPFLGAAKSFADAGSELADASARTGVSVEALSALGHAAGQTGSDLSTVEGAIRKMQKALVAGSEENLQAQATFESLGLSVEALSRLSPEKQFQAVAKAIAKVPNPTAKAGAAMQVFGKSGTALIPMINDLDKLTAEAKAFGLVWTGEEADKADALGDSLDLLAAVMRRVAQTVGSALAPILTELAGALANAAKRVLDFVNANRPLVVAAFKIGVGIALAGAALVALGAAIAAVGAVLGGIAAGIAAVGAAIAFLASPVGLTIAALAAATVAFFKFTSAGQEALGWLGARFAELKADALAVFGGIADALKAGDIALAGQILWQGLKVEWLKGTLFLKQVWAEWGGWAISLWRDTQFELAKSFVDLGFGFQSTWVKAIGGLRDAWTFFIGFLQKSWNSFGGFFAQVWERIKSLFAGGDLDKEIARINAETAKANAAVDVGTAQTLVGRGIGRNKELAGIEANRAEAQKALQGDQEAERAAREKAAKELVAQGAAELKAAQDELAKLLGKAAQEAADAGKPAAKGPKGAEEFTPQGLDQGLEQIQRKVETKGTFSAAGIRGLATGDSVSEQIKDGLKEQQKEQKKTNEHLSKIARNVAVFKA